MHSVDKVKVSVITYVRNTISYIEQCVRSVMNQTLREIEILVVDGGSTDGTLEIIGKLQKEDRRIRLLHAPASVGAQFNLGLSEAKGEYIAICEADDYILPEMLEKQYLIAHKNQLDVLRADYYQFCNVFEKEYRFYTKTCFSEEKINKIIDGSKDDFFLEQGIRGFWNGIYNREFLINNNVHMNETAGASYQDITFSFLTQMLAKTIWFMDEAFYCYRIDNPDASVNSENCIQIHIREYEYLSHELKKRGLWERYKDMYYKWEIGSYSYFISQLPYDVQHKRVREVYNHLKEQNDKEHYEKENKIEHLQEVTKSLIEGEQAFSEKLCVNALERFQMLDYFAKGFVQDDNIVLFGAGHMGSIVKKFLDLSKKKFLLADNNKKLHREGFEGNKVYAPEKIVETNPSSTYIIANLSHAQDMVDQLVKLGIEKDKIIVCCDEILFLRKVFASAKV